MRRIILAVTLAFMVGCVGSPNAHNPMNQARNNQPWWAATTAGVSSADNPWEIYVRPNPLLVSDDPWSTYEAPPLFPEGWKPAEKKKVDSPKERPIINRHDQDKVY